MYMMVFCPAQVFEEMSPLAVSAMDAGRLLLSCFEGIIDAIIKGAAFRNLDVNLRASFPELLFDYLTKFMAWKVPDQEKLVGRFRHALIALYGALETVPEEQVGLRIELDAQIERLRTKLQQIAGVEELNDFDAYRAASGPFEPSTRVVARNHRFTNEQLAHELFIDPGFRLSEGISDYYTVITEGLQYAFWDSVADDLRLTPPCNVRIIRVLHDIKKSLEDVGCDRVRIQTVIDLPLIQAGVDAGALHWGDVTTLVSGVFGEIKTVQSPARVANTDTVWQEIRQLRGDGASPTVLCKALQSIVKILGGLRMDAANARYFFQY